MAVLALVEYMCTLWARFTLAPVGWRWLHMNLKDSSDNPASAQKARVLPRSQPEEPPPQ